MSSLPFHRVGVLDGLALTATGAICLYPIRRPVGSAVSFEAPGQAEAYEVLVHDAHRDRVDSGLVAYTVRGRGSSAAVGPGLYTAPSRYVTFCLWSFLSMTPSCKIVRWHTLDAYCHESHGARGGWVGRIALQTLNDDYEYKYGVVTTGLPSSADFLLGPRVECQGYSERNVSLPRRPHRIGDSGGLSQTVTKPAGRRHCPPRAAV